MSPLAGIVPDTADRILVDVNALVIEVHSMPTGTFECRLERGEPFVRRVVEEGRPQ